MIDMKCYSDIAAEGSGRISRRTLLISTLENPDSSTLITKGFWGRMVINVKDFFCLSYSGRQNKKLEVYKNFTAMLKDYYRSSEAIQDSLTNLDLISERRTLRAKDVATILLQAETSYAKWNAQHPEQNAREFSTDGDEDGHLSPRQTDLSENDKGQSEYYGSESDLGSIKENFSTNKTISQEMLNNISEISIPEHQGNESFSSNLVPEETTSILNTEEQLTSQSASRTDSIIEGNNPSDIQSNQETSYNISEISIPEHQDNVSSSYNLMSEDTASKQDSGKILPGPYEDPVTDSEGEETFPIFTPLQLRKNRDFNVLLKSTARKTNLMSEDTVGKQDSGKILPGPYEDSVTDSEGEDTFPIFTPLHREKLKKNAKYGVSDSDVFPGYRDVFALRHSQNIKLYASTRSINMYDFNNEDDSVLAQIEEYISLDGTKDQAIAKAQSIWISTKPGQTLSEEECTAIRFFTFYKEDDNLNILKISNQVLISSNNDSLFIPFIECAKSAFDKIVDDTTISYLSSGIINTYNSDITGNETELAKKSKGFTLLGLTNTYTEDDGMEIYNISTNKGKKITMYDGTEKKEFLVVPPNCSFLYADKNTSADKKIEARLKPSKLQQELKDASGVIIPKKKRTSASGIKQSRSMGFSEDLSIRIPVLADKELPSRRIFASLKGGRYLTSDESIILELAANNDINDENNFFNYMNYSLSEGKNHWSVIAPAACLNGALDKIKDHKGIGCLFMKIVNGKLVGHSIKSGTVNSYSGSDFSLEMQSFKADKAEKNDTTEYLQDFFSTFKNDNFTVEHERFCVLCELSAKEQEEALNDSNVVMLRYISKTGKQIFFGGDEQARKFIIFGTSTSFKVTDVSRTMVSGQPIGALQVLLREVGVAKVTRESLKLFADIQQIKRKELSAVAGTKKRIS